MQGKYREIDLINWKRATHCQVFRNCAQPQYAVGFELDITGFRPAAKAKKLPFTFALIHAVTKCANMVEEFRYRFADGKVVLFDEINTAFTYMDADTELFKFVEVEMRPTAEEYAALAAETAGRQREYFTGPPGNDVFIFSPMPWVPFTYVTHTFSGNRDQAAPMFDWGKFFERDGKLMLPFSVQVHHSFVDGVHIGKLADGLQDYLNGF
ncbi:MAG: CatA-like O-acetyltransferase [Victivallaceae bacterium]|nr:CatA-like O-acetyltransferase [Victivallaceae bacterium]